MNGLEGGKVARDGDRGLRQPSEGQSLRCLLQLL